MWPITYSIVGQRGCWFVEHSRGRFGPFKTKKEALSLAAAATKEGEALGYEVEVKDAQ